MTRLIQSGSETSVYKASDYTTVHCTANNYNAFHISGNKKFFPLWLYSQLFYPIHSNTVKSLIHISQPLYLHPATSSSQMNNNSNFTTSFPFLLCCVYAGLLWAPPVSLFVFTFWHFLGYEFHPCGAMSMCICKPNCLSENAHRSVHHQHRINRLLRLWGAGGRRSSSPTRSPHRAVVVSGLSLAFLSRPVEMGLMMKCSTPSVSCLNIHLQLEADHHTSTYTSVPYIPPLAFPLHPLSPFPPPSILDR